MSEQASENEVAMDTSSPATTANSTPQTSNPGTPRVEEVRATPPPVRETPPPVRATPPPAPAVRGTPSPAVVRATPPPQVKATPPHSGKAGPSPSAFRTSGAPTQVKSIPAHLNIPSPGMSFGNSAYGSNQRQVPHSQSKYGQLLSVIEELGKDIRPTYAGSKVSSEKLKRGIVHARILVRECLMECERSARS